MVFDVSDFSAMDKKLVTLLHEKDADIQQCFCFRIIRETFLKMILRLSDCFILAAYFVYKQKFKIHIFADMIILLY